MVAGIAVAGVEEKAWSRRDIPSERSSWVGTWLRNVGRQVVSDAFRVLLGSRPEIPGAVSP